ncbi:hypothetical protein [Rufibacter tibetensis]|uniref:Uncharacterized protein n=1 Tax=Rufibacter tibetensis TaxID=512763 RepID=A0A0N7HXC7_9BACT|nr:hypothetical protein [Rufibacter tibetensis]ALJ01681.1 hypothetical protein DC20_21750 [Rufibacter tibetensis]
MKILPKNFNPLAFITISLIIALLMFASFIAAFAEDEGTSGGGLLSTILAATFQILRFPFHTLFWGVITEYMALYFPALLLNIIFYSFAIERLIAFISKGR